MVSTMVVSCRSRSPLMWSQRLARLCGSIPVDGSSRKISRGLCIRPRAMSSLRRCPPDSVLTFRLSSEVRSRVLVSSWARARESEEFIP